MIKRLVISYSTADRAIADSIRDQLIEAGYEIWIAHDNDSIRGSVDWTQTILDAIDSRDGLILVWSEFAAISDDVREEIRIARVFRKPIFPINAHPKKEVPSLPAEIKSLQVINMGSFDLNISELKTRFADPKKSNIQYADLAKYGFIPKSPNPSFIGRDRELKDLFVDSRGYGGQTKIGVPIAITGLAGIGKTELALVFGFRFNLFFPDGVYWVDAPSGIVPEFCNIGPQLGVKLHRDERPTNYANRVLENLRQLHKGLIIFDNVANFSEFRQWCPTGLKSCSVILTTRLFPRGFPARVMNLTELDSDSALEMLIARRDDRDAIRRDKVQLDALKELCQIKGNHPLALELIASHLQSGFIRPSNYLKDIQSDPIGRFNDEKESDFSLDPGTASLAEILLHGYSGLNEELVGRYFLLMCCFASHGINEELITQSYDKPSEGERALDELSRNSFIRREPTNNTLSLHPLVAQFGRALQKHKDFDYPGKFTEVMLGFLRAHQDKLNSEAVRREKPHIDEVLRLAQDKALWEPLATLHEYNAVIEVGFQEKIESLKKAYQIIVKYLPTQKRRLLSIRLRLGKVRRTAGQLNDALDDFNQAEALYREIRDVDPAELASLRFELGATRLALGSYPEGEKILSDALAMALTYFDVSSPQVLQFRQALAELALYLGNYDSAEAGFTEILSERKKFYTTQPDPTSAAGLASAHADLSRLALARAHYSDAIRVANEALTITKEYYKESEPECSQIYLLLGIIHYKSGEYVPAEKQLDKALSDFSATFGESHPDYAKTLIALGEVYRKQGKFDKAEKEVERAIDIFENIYGKNHPSVAEALEVQAKIYDHHDELDKEQLVWERILKIQHHFYSEQHPALATTNYDYASLFLRRGDYAKAAEHLQSSLQITEKNFGKTHTDYFGRLVRLATCRYEQQEFLLAQRILDDAKKMQYSVFGDSPHPFIARMLQTQSEILRRQGRFAEALEVIEQAIDMKKVIYGKEDHPSVAESMAEKVKIFHHLEKGIETKLLIDRTLGIRRKIYGEKHPEVSSSIHDLGVYYLDLGQYKEAAEQFEQARNNTALVFGKSHPDYVERTLHLANARNDHGEYQLALDLLEEVKGAVPSGNHYLTARWLQLQGELMRRMGQFAAAMNYINQAIAMKETIYGRNNHPSVAEALEVQAKIYDHLDELDKEQLVWERILNIQHHFYSEQHPALATTYHDYANLYVKNGEYAKALELLDKSLDITEKSLGKTHADYFGRLILRASCLYEQQAYLQAQTVLEDAKGLQHNIFGDSPHPFIARMLQTQSKVLRQLGRFAEALEVIEQAIDMKKVIYGKEDHPSVAEALEVKVDLTLSQLQVQESSEILNIIERIRSKTYGKNHPDFANYQMRLARWYEISGRYDEAREIMEQSLQTCLSIFSAEHPENIRRMIELARIARMVNDIVGAEKRINDVCEIFGSRLEKEDSLIVAETYQVLSYIRRAQGNYRAALTELEKALRIKTKIFGFEGPAVIELQNERARSLIAFHRLTEANDVIEHALRNIESDHPLYALLRSDLLAQRGILQDYKQEYDQAIESIEEAIKLRKHLLGGDNAELARLYVEKAVVLRHQSKYDEALTNLDVAQTIDNRHFDGNHVYFARILLEQGQTYLNKKRIDVAQEHLKESLHIYEIQPNRNLKQHSDAIEAIGQVYLESGRSRDAFELFEKAMMIRMDIYGSSHPVIAEALYKQAQALLKIARTDENQDAKVQARQKLEQAQVMLGQRDDDYAGMVSEIEITLANL